MNISQRRTFTAGFSMVELMTVIGIMILLAGLLIASLPGIQTRVNRGKVEAFIAELEGGLSKYEIDNGIYPQNPPSGDRDDSGMMGAAVLYKHLSGDWDLNGRVDDDAEIYVRRLSLEENQDSKEPRSDDRRGEGPEVVDSYGNPIRYLAQPPNIKVSERKTYNPTYDIWSIVDADPNDPQGQAKHITNWQSK